MTTFAGSTLRGRAGGPFLAAEDGRVPSRFPSRRFQLSMPSLLALPARAGQLASVILTGLPARLLSAGARGRGGIGLGLAEPDMRIQYVIAGGSASEHPDFFEPGDALVAVDGRVVSGMRLREVSELIIGEEGTEVEIRIMKAGKQESESIVLTRRGAGKKRPVPKPAQSPRPAGEHTEPLPQPIIVAPLIFQPEDGHAFTCDAATSEFTVRIHCSTPDVQIRYTTDNSVPAALPKPAGLIYGGGGIQLDALVPRTWTINAIAAVRDRSPAALLTVRELCMDVSISSR